MFLRNAAPRRRRTLGLYTGASSSTFQCHLRNHGFLWLGKTGWSLSPTYDLDPVPVDLKTRVLTTNIDLDVYLIAGSAGKRLRVLCVDAGTDPLGHQGHCDRDLPDTAKEVGARITKMDRMASAFEHHNRKQALSL